VSLQEMTEDGKTTPVTKVPSPAFAFVSVPAQTTVPADVPPAPEMPAFGLPDPEPARRDTARTEPLPKEEDGEEETVPGSTGRNQVLCGKPINTKDEISLEMCDVERRGVAVRGLVSSVSIREIREGKGLLSMRLTDYVSTVNVKAFVVMKTYRERMETRLVKGATVLVKGNLQMDTYLQDLVLTASSITLCGEPLHIDEEKKAAAEAMILGRPFTGDRMTIASVLSGKFSGRGILQGDILKTEEKELRNERTLVTIDITDYTDSISVKAYFDNDELDKKGGMLKKGKQIKVLGIIRYEDEYAHEYQITADAIAPASDKIRKERIDGCEKKRVELHAHTKISEMDAVTAPKELVGQAIKWGHPAIAITDHGVVQGFPEAMDASRKADIKVIYGVEAYLVDDTRKAVYKEKSQSFQSRFAVFDIETTGFDKDRENILEIGAVMVENGEIVDRFSHFIDPLRPIPPRITELTSITDEDVKGQGTIEVVLPLFLNWVGDAALVAHNAAFDTGFIANKAAKLGMDAPDNTIVDTLELARGLYDLRKYTLDSVAKHLNVSLENHHRAVDDAEATAGIFIKMLEQMRAEGITDVDHVNDYIHEHTDVKKLRSHHAIILVKNKAGLRNLYELVSLSHLNYFYRQPRIPKTEVQRLREGLILGSACSAGELFEAVLENDGEDEIRRLAEFYDYLEIQPIGNNRYLLDDEDHPAVKNEEDLRDLNRRIYALGQKYGKPVCATGDVHFKEPEDQIFREILLSAKDMDEPQPPLYFHTTEEMLEEFAYLGEEAAEEVVITNTNRIADMVEKVLPIPDGQFSPVIEGAEEELKQVCYDKAHSMYGDPLPPIVQERLDHELDCIIRNGFSTLYILARRLVLHSVGDGYYVGSRGSVGSSLAATMSGITEINPLKAHYYCKKCQFSDFDPPESRNVAGMSGFDLPDRACPRCGTPLTRDGQEIPFEVFLGFDGDKEPDIDLNFSGEYQPRAHAYVEEMFGSDHVFRAGTMGGLAEKTAYGMIRHYLEEKGKTLSNAQINYLISGCLDVKRTTGQHPGGQIIVPKGYSVYDFTPVQHPANDMTTSIVTTHYDYDQLHGRLLKLDILGHDDPTMIRMLEDTTQTVAADVPLNDPDVMELFLSTKSLGVTPEQIDSPVGTFGISEFGTHFVRQMLVETKPKSFSDLCRISGLSHGTDVWNNNAHDIVNNGIAPISACICTREDIMIDLIHLGMDKLESFKIMEKVRKGKKSGGLSPTDIEHMVAHGIEPWYLESCKKIQYLFPKGHAAAYVTMSLRIAYYKVHYKEYYYAAFFTIRADSFDYEKMATGEANARKAKEAIEAKGREETTAKDKEIHTLLELVVEFYARGCRFLPMDLQRSDSHKFQVIDGQLLPPFDTISGMGQTAAQSIVDARNEAPFGTIADFLERTRVSRTLADTMKGLGIMGDMPETDQMSLF
ncbi:MAG: PolC-type DNA polymerase III, partial [Lachnospiraceae bacterium]|nr:PolC-type DNA polymerase III [Lachnospiraceae bacterium]